MEAKFTRGPYQREGRSIYKLVDNPAPRKGHPGQVNLWFAGVSPGGIGIDTAELEAVATLFQASPLLYEALEDSQWGGAPAGGQLTCPQCGNQRKYGHTPQCLIGNALRAARGEK